MSDGADNPHRIGALNGPYALLFKLVLVSYPIILGGGITFSAWVTSNIYEFRGWMGQGARFTGQDAKVMAAEVKEQARNERDVELNRVRGEMLLRLTEIATKQETLSVAQTAMRESLFEMKADIRLLAPKDKPTIRTTQ